MAACTRKELTVGEKEQIIRLTEQGYSFTDVAEIVGKSRYCVSKVIKRKEQTCNIQNMERSGRPKLTSQHGDRSLIRLLKKTEDSL